MSGTSRKERRSFAATRRGLGLLLVWLNLVVTPCAMAIEVEHSCPHCPPAHMQAMGGHEGHATKGHQGHAEASEAPSCSAVQSDCCDMAAASVDSRGGKPGEDHPSHGSLAPPPAYTGLLDDVRHYRATLDAHPPEPPGASPPLRVLFCVYLD
jgi:hypothetical protein